MEGLVEGQCERVFGALVKGVGVGGGEVKGVGVGGGQGAGVEVGGGEGASVNLVRGPVGVEGMWGVEGEGKGFTGMFFCSFFCGFWFFGFLGGFFGLWEGRLMVVRLGGRGG